MRIRHLIALSTLVVSSTAAAQAPAGSGFDAHGFRLAAHDADLRDPLVVLRPGAFEGQSWFVGGLLEYAAQPLVFRRPEGGTTTELDNLTGANLSAGYAPTDRIRLDLAAPLYVYADGRDEALGAGLGDIRSTAMIELVRPEGADGEGRLGTALIANLDLPTGNPTNWLGQTTVAGGVGIAVTYELDRLTLTGMGGTQLRPNTSLDERPAPTKGGDAFVWGGAVGYVLSEQAGMTAEVHGEIAADDDVQTALGTPVEALVSFRHVRQDGGFLTAGLGTGLTRGAGASPLRLVVGGGFGSGGEPAAGDMDGDGIVDLEDTCPTTPETVNGFADEDGCRDAPAVLTFRAVRADGEVVEDATLDVEGPLSLDGIGALTFQGEKVGPDSQWTAKASRGACLVGGTAHRVGSRGGEQVIDVVLEPVFAASVRVDAVDPDGKPIPGARARFRTDDEDCAPPEGMRPDSTGTYAVGPGMHFVFVSADGYSVHQESFTIEEGGTHVVDAVLTPALARVDRSDPDHVVISILEKVYFDTGRATIQERSHPLLKEVAQVIRSNALGTIEIGGHTDSQGAASSNQRLSQQRAEAVRTFLIDNGIDGSQLLAVGYGEERPVADNGTAAGRATNRRVEFTVLAAD
jgi:outer membrane protein OmpA-like peptidoglycan-associated protein